MQFEYKIITVSRQHLKKESFQAEFLAKINDLGLLGWELTNTEGINTNSFFSRSAETNEILFVFKRQI
jgi:hypothetical protein